MRPMLRSVPALVCVAAIAVVHLPAGCAGDVAIRNLSVRADSDLVASFPAEGRRWTYEAENEVIISLDKVETKKRDLLRLQEEWMRREATVAAVKERGGPALEVVAGREAWVRAEVKRAQSELDLLTQAVLCARAALELTKARLCVQFDLPVEEDYIEPFDEQYDACAEEQRALLETAEERIQEANRAKESWRQVRAEFVKRTGDHNHGLWID